MFRHVNARRVLLALWFVSVLTAFPAQKSWGATETKPVVRENSVGEKVLAEPVVGKNFVVMPITTDLQRAAGRMYRDAKVLVLINALGLINKENTVLDTSAVALDELDSALSSIIADGVRGAAVFRLLNEPDGPSRATSASQVFASFLRTNGRQWFSEVDVESVRHASAENWPLLIAQLTQAPEPAANQDETGVGDERVKVYPIRTPLSRYLFSHEDDCVVRVIPPLDQVNENIVPQIARALDQLQLQEREAMLLFHVKGTAGGNSMLEKLRDDQVAKDQLRLTWNSLMLWR